MIQAQNMLLVGIIPGPSEPSHNINTFLQPLVLELKEFWQGICLNVYRSAGVSNEVLVRCALLCIACDIPAGRKVCGFLSHSAAKGCSKCYKEFYGGVRSSSTTCVTPQNNVGRGYACCYCCMQLSLVCIDA